MIQNTLPKEVLIRSLIKGLWSDSSTKDLEIICGGLEPRPSVPCHRPILALASPFVKSLVQGEKPSPLRLITFFETDATRMGGNL